MISLWSSQCVAVVMKVLITQDGVKSYLGSNFNQMNPALVLQQIKKLNEDLESLKAPIDPDEDVSDQDYQF